jgi:gluconolactonase
LEEQAMPIEPVAPECTRLVDLDQEVEWLGSGFGADATALGLPWWPAEGPVWWQEGGYLLFSDIGQSKRMKWAPGEGVTLFAAPTNEANGMTRDPQGRLIACEHAAQRVTRLEPDGRLTVVADRYQGKRLNRPNDVVVKSDGSIYFTHYLKLLHHPGGPVAEGFGAVPGRCRLDLSCSPVYNASCRVRWK